MMDPVATLHCNVNSKADCGSYLEKQKYRLKLIQGNTQNHSSHNDFFVRAKFVIKNCGKEPFKQYVIFWLIFDAIPHVLLRDTVATQPF